MRLEEYWGVGPKTRELLTEELGVEAAVTAIDSGDVQTLVAAGLPRGRATRILRRAQGGEALDSLATPDTREVYKQLVALASSYAVTEAAADRIRILTPLSTQDAMKGRLDEILTARDSWAELSADRREQALGAFEAYDEAGGDRQAAVSTAIELREADFEDGVFAPLAELDADALAAARSALVGLAGGGGIADGADERLDDVRERLRSVEDMSATPGDVLSSIQSDARTTDDLRETLARTVTEETGVDAASVREAMPPEAVDAAAFVEETLRTLLDDLRERVTEREREIRERYESVLAETESSVTSAVAAISDIAFVISLARFALEFDLTRPELVDGQVVSMVDARNLALVERGEDVQPITYAIGDHSLSLSAATGPPSGDRVTVLTGANSGGKTTLLETVCQVQLLAQMGLPVPATEAEVGIVETVVFHRRHASFNAGVLESTLRTVVPPLASSGRTLMLVDEFEAITEPGRAADLLHGLVTLTVETDAMGVFVTHLADDLQPLPEAARIDGIFAEGLTPDLALQVDYQPQFETVGRSTPEFIVSRLVANASDRTERAGYEHLAEAVGEAAVQRTLADARWTE